jgi:hypothetical protein
MHEKEYFFKSIVGMIIKEKDWIIERHQVEKEDEKVVKKEQMLLLVIHIIHMRVISVSK